MHTDGKGQWSPDMINPNSEIKLPRAVAQAGSLLCPPTCSRQGNLQAEWFRKVRGVGGLQTRETAGCQPALRLAAHQATAEFGIKP